MVTREEYVEPFLGGGLGGVGGPETGMCLVGRSEGGGSTSPCRCVREEFNLLWRQLANAAYGRCEDLVDAIHVFKWVFAGFIRDENQFDRPFSWQHGGCVVVCLFMGWEEPHVSGEIRMSVSWLLWLRIAAWH